MLKILFELRIDLVELESLSPLTQLRGLILYWLSVQEVNKLTARKIGKLSHT